MIYKEIIESKNGLKLPVFKNGKPMHSKYNPQNEALLFAKDNYSDFFIILGIGGAYHIRAIQEQNKNSLIIAIEESKEDIDFLMEIPETKKCAESENIIFTDFKNLKENLLTNYNPYIYNKLTILKHRSWVQENPLQAENAESIIKESISLVSQDFSVQSHFGKLWHRNILNNYILFEDIIKNQSELLKGIPNKKIAAVIAAGPSLDQSVLELTENRNDYFIISTDTAYGTLTKNKIIPDACITVDAQNISHTHYLNLLNPEKTIFIFDISSSSSSINHIKNSKGNIYLVKNNHPLSTYFDKSNNLLNLSSGSGTVTIAACDFADKAGFTKIKLFGADFSYGNGKPYAKGTYLETQFNSLQKKILPDEIQNTKLMFRTELFPSETKKLLNPKTSKIMESYKKTMEEWFKLNSYSANLNEKSESLYLKSEENNTPPAFNCEKNPDSFDYKNSVTEWINEITDTLVKTQNNSINPKDLLLQNQIITTLLPLIANIKKNNETLDFFSLVKLAHSLSKRYTYI